MSSPDTAIFNSRSSRTIEKKRITVPAIRMTSNEDEFMDRNDHSFTAKDDKINNDNKSMKDDSKNDNLNLNLNLNLHLNQSMNGSDAGMVTEEEVNKIIHLPLDSLFEENKSCQQTLINFGR